MTLLFEQPTRNTGDSYLAHRVVSYLAISLYMGAASLNLLAIRCDSWKIHPGSMLCPRCCSVSLIDYRKSAQSSLDLNWGDIIIFQ